MTARSKPFNIDIEKIAHLARLPLSEDQKIKFKNQIDDVLKFVGILKKLDTKNISPTSQVTGLENIFREDEIKPSLSQKEALSNSNSIYNGYFKVPAIFED